MGIPRFIKLPSNKKFEYAPRYWDPEKEKREERIRMIRQEAGLDVSNDPGRTTIRRGSFRSGYHKTKVRASRSSNIRLVIILAVLLLISYLVFLR